MSDKYVVVSDGRALAMPQHARLPASKLEVQGRHIVGVHVEERGAVAAVWLADAYGSVTVYDSSLYPAGTHLAIVADDIKRRGAWKPIAFRQQDEEYIEALKRRGCSVLSFSRKEVHAYEETQLACQTLTLEIDERAASGRFDWLLENEAWANEFDSFGPGEDGEYPLTGSPLISATRHAFRYLYRAIGPPKALRPQRIETRGIV